MEMVTAIYTLLILSCHPVIHPHHVFFIFRRNNYTPKKEDRHLIKTKLRRIKKLFPIDSPVRILMSDHIKTKKKKSHKIVWSEEIYYVSKYKCPPSPVEDVAIRLKKHKFSQKKNDTIKGVFYPQELKLIRQ